LVASWWHDAGVRTSRFAGLREPFYHGRRCKPGTSTDFQGVSGDVVKAVFLDWEAAVLPLNYARLDTYQTDLAETAPSAKRLGGLSRRNLNLVRIF
jgi:hypothetical protein